MYNGQSTHKWHNTIRRAKPHTAKKKKTKKKTKKEVIINQEL